MTDPQYRGIAHASLIVADTERAMHFYRDVLQMSVSVSRPALGFPGAWLELGDQQIHLLELPNPDPVNDRPAHGGRDRHTAIDVGNLEWLVSALDTAAIPYTKSQSGRAAIFCRDPDGNTLEFIEKGGD